MCVIDSVQTLHCADLSSAAGSVAQVREVAGEIMRVAKAQGIAVLLVGHVTKDGALAGPRVLEHLVDCVLQFEGERERTYRTLRAIKNRFGLDQRGRRVRDARPRPGRGAGRLGAVRRRGHARSRAASCCARWRARGRCWSRSRRWSPVGAGAAAAGRVRPGPQPRGAGAGGARPPRRDRARRPPTCSSTSSAACASTSPARIWRSRWRSPARRKRSALTGAGGRAAGLLRRARADRRAAHGRRTPTVGWPRPRNSV